MTRSHPALSTPHLDHDGANRMIFTFLVADGAETLAVVDADMEDLIPVALTWDARWLSTEVVPACRYFCPESESIQLGSGRMRAGQAGRQAHFQKI